MTRRPIILDRLTILKRIWDRTYVVVLPDANGNGAVGKLADSDTRVDLGTLTKEVRDGIERRLAYLDALQKGHVTRGQRKRVDVIVRATARRIGDKKPPSASTVMEWTRQYQRSGHNPLALRNGNSWRVRHRRTHERMERIISKCIRTVYLTRDRHTLQHTLDCIQRETKQLVLSGELEPHEAKISLATLTRRVREIDLFRRIAAREGMARARMACRTAMGGAGAAYPLQRVEIDHTPLNWVVICDRTGLPLGRPLLTIAIDAFSGYVLGIYLSFYGPGVSSVSGVMRNAVIPKTDFVRGVALEHTWIAAGIPDLMIIDNGLEFHSGSFKLMAWDLACDLMYCRVRTPWLKPHVERFFGSLDYLTLTRGRIRKRVANVMNLDPRKDAAIKFTDLVKGLIQYVVDVYPFDINERKLARPYDLMLEGMEDCPPAFFPGDIHALRLTSALSKELTLGPGGIELLGLPYGGPELLPMRKRHGERFRTLVKWDPDDMASIWIQDPTDRTWVESACRWSDYATSLSWNQHRLIRKFARECLKLAGAHEHLQAARLRLHDHWLDATSHKTAADTKLAAAYSGVTSARVMEPASAALPSPAPQCVIADTEVPPPMPREIPTFDAFEMA